MTGSDVYHFNTVATGERLRLLRAVFGFALHPYSSTHCACCLSNVRATGKATV